MKTYYVCILSISGQRVHYKKKCISATHNALQKYRVADFLQRRSTQRCSNLQRIERCRKGGYANFIAANYNVHYVAENICNGNCVADNICNECARTVIALQTFLKFFKKNSSLIGRFPIQFI